MRCLALISAITLSLMVSAQNPDSTRFSKGQFLVAGEFHLGVAATAGKVDPLYCINPTFGYFLKNRWVVGLEFQQFSFSHLTPANGFSSGFFTRYYLPSLLRGRLTLYAQAGFSFGQYNYTTQGELRNYPSGSLSMALAVDFMLSKHVSLIVSVQKNLYTNPALNGSIGPGSGLGIVIRL